MDSATRRNAWGPPRWARWRHDQLTRAGFDDPLATELSTDPDVDLHALLDLVARGCPPPLAVRILEPLARQTRTALR